MDVERTRPVVVVMGVSGSGKTTVGRMLAERLGVEYAEGDEFHPAGNVAKMASGLPLDDEDRCPWLSAIAGWIAERLRSGRGGVVSCSALKYRYRDVLRQAGPGVRFLHLDVDRETTAARVARRTGHFMPVSLVESQFEALEPLRPDERGGVVDAGSPPEETVENGGGAAGRIIGTFFSGNSTAAGLMRLVPLTSFAAIDSVCVSVTEPHGI